ncbi:MAG: DNA-3-methyladenine glycosylase [Patescibacteria group bacterium]|nr:DNA-3-methyladenine glycosylase [Patescibacteria group bacterium]
MNEEILLHFQRKDPILFRVFSLVPPFRVSKSDNLYFSLLSCIVAQQLSIKAADAIIARFCNLFSNQPTPETTLAISKEQLRHIGMSWKKIEYIQSIARSILNKELDMTTFDMMTDNMVIQKLTQIKGIGRWTAEMFLMSGLGREDVFSYQDLGLQKGIQKIYHLSSRPTKKEMESISLRWRPYRTYAAYTIWRSLSLTCL